MLSHSRLEAELAAQCTLLLQLLRLPAVSQLQRDNIFWPGCCSPPPPLTLETQSCMYQLLSLVNHWPLQCGVFTHAAAFAQLKAQLPCRELI